jgi:hypothetical protein
MPSYTYPVARPTGTLTTAQIHLLLSNPRLVAKRVAQLTDQRFISDYLLSGRYEARGGGVFYETGEQIFAADSAEAIESLGEYPLTVLTRGELAAAKTSKIGLGTEIADEAISRLGQNTVDRALTRLANQVIKDVDSIAMAIIASKVTSTVASSAWTTVAAVVSALLAAQANREDLALGIRPDVVALTGAQWAKVMGLFASAGVLPREDGNPLVNGQYPQNLLGFTWVTSPWLVGSDPLLVDREQLGGMADEDLGSPDYTRAGTFNVETHIERITPARDGYRAHARRVTVPVVIESQAGIKITGTGL